MALAFLTSGRATGMDLLQVVHLDRTALVALARGDVSQAPAEALMDYVSARELGGVQPPATVPKEFLNRLPHMPSAPAPPGPPIRGGSGS